MAIRLSKTVLVLLAGFYALIVAFNNVVDYGSNLSFVQHVLMMDTTFPDNELRGRAINAPAIHHAAYVAIIIAEFSVALLCLFGAFKLYQARQDESAFRGNKIYPVYGLTLAVILWFGGFIVVGAEWFAMWQSQYWNGVEAAFRIAVLFSLILIYLTTAPDD